MFEDREKPKFENMAGGLEQDIFDDKSEFGEDALEEFADEDKEKMLWWMKESEK